MALHLCDFGFDEVELLMQFQVIFVFLLLQPLLLVEGGSARVFIQLPAAIAPARRLVLRGWILLLLALVPVRLPLLILAALGSLDGIIGLTVVSSSVPVHIWRVVLTGVLLIAIVLQASFDGFVDARLSGTGRVVLEEPILVLGFGVVSSLSSSHLNNNYQ